MKHPKILYPSSSINLKDLIWFGNLNAYYPNFELTNNVSVKFMDEDEKYSSEANIKLNPTLHDWNYEINTSGFRGKWDLNSDVIKIGFFGCSITLGQGVVEHDIFSSVVEQYYTDNVKSLNFGTTGASIQRVAKIISASSNLIDFDIIVITLPPSTRFAFIKHDVGMLTDLLPDQQNLPEYKSLYNILTQDDFDMYACDAIQWIKAELRGKKILYSSWCPYTYEILKNLVDKEQLLPLFPMNDTRARDSMHPSSVCHKSYAEYIIQRLDDLNWILKKD